MEQLPPAGGHSLSSAQAAIAAIDDSPVSRRSRSPHHRPGTSSTAGTGSSSIPEPPVIRDPQVRLAELVLEIQKTMLELKTPSPEVPAPDSTNVHPDIYKAMVDIKKTFATEIKKLKKATRRLESAKKEVEFCGKSEYLPSTTPYTCNVMAESMDHVWPEARTEAHEIVVRIPQGSSRREVCRIFHQRSISEIKHLEFEAIQEDVDRLRAATTREKFMESMAGVPTTAANKVDELGIGTLNRHWIEDRESYNKIAGKMYDDIITYIESQLRAEDRQAEKVRRAAESNKIQLDNIDPVEALGTFISKHVASALQNTAETEEPEEQDVQIQEAIVDFEAAFPEQEDYVISRLQEAHAKNVLGSYDNRQNSAAAKKKLFKDKKNIARILAQLEPEVRSTVQAKAKAKANPATKATSKPDKSKKDDEAVDNDAGKDKGKRRKGKGKGKGDDKASTLPKSNGRGSKNGKSPGGALGHNAKGKGKDGKAGGKGKKKGGKNGK